MFRTNWQRFAVSAEFDDSRGGYELGGHRPGDGERAHHICQAQCKESARCQAGICTKMRTLLMTPALGSKEVFPLRFFQHQLLPSYVELSCDIISRPDLRPFLRAGIDMHSLQVILHGQPKLSKSSEVGAQERVGFRERGARCAERIRLPVGFGRIMGEQPPQFCPCPLGERVIYACCTRYEAG